MSPGAEPAAIDAHGALGALRRARRRRRIADLDPFEALYRVYVSAIVAGIAIWLGSGLVGGRRVDPHGAAAVAAQGPGWIGLAVAGAFAVGLRSGGRGGPLVIEAADVRHVLLSPVDRALALRAPALRQLRFAAAAAAGVGALVGLLVYRRLGGDPVAWVVSGAATASLTVLGALGLALVASGSRVGSRVGSLLALVVAGWGAADAATSSVTSPMSLLGQLALWPLRFRLLGVVGLVVPLGAVVVGLALVGSTSIEAAERRATLVGQIRFAATLRDLRTVVVLRRQLAQELPRSRPWVQLRPVISPGRRHQVRFPAWRRGWHGILRFPGLRLGRMALLGAAAGAAAVGAWRGTVPLIAAAGVALYVAALDAVEPVAQELDHPDRCEAYDVESGELYLRQAGPSLVVMLVVTAFGVAAAVAVTGGSVLAAEVGGLLAIPAAAAAVAGALLGTLQGSGTSSSVTDAIIPPEIAGIKAIVKTILPPAVATVGLLPLLAGRHPAAGLTPLSGVASTALEPLVVVALAAGWVRYRDRMAEWWRNAQQEAASNRRGATPPPPGRPG